MGKKFVAGFEVVLMVVSLFAFMYFVDLSTEAFVVVSAADDDEEDLTFREWMDGFKGGVLTEEESWSSYPISASADGAGCCFVGEDGQICGTASPENCVSDSPFAEGVLCAATSFCEKGCCYDEASGIYDKNVLEFACPSEWVKDPNCNMPGARLGCCVLGSESVFETEGQCEVDSLVRALGGEEVVDWRGDVGEGACLFLSAVQKEGACVLVEGGCKFVSEADCFSYDGEFSENYLCTSPSLNTSCEMTRQTKCVDGKDGVYFVDSCGNVANIYDAGRVEDVDYWDVVVEPLDICGAVDFENGNADSVDCGNCNRFAGGICASADEDGFEVDVGSFYCRDTSCMFDGKSYSNGESWCVYDGAIGNGDDVVGSRHWKYVCSQGVVQVEPCADYRNQICVQSKEFEVNGTMIEFENAACIANNWRACIDLNGKDSTESSVAADKACVAAGSRECRNSTLYPGDYAKMNCVDDVVAGCGGSEMDGVMSECAASLNCRVETVDIADKFKFDICLPKYPGGFSLNDPRYQESAERLCGMADQMCTVVYKPNTWGGCSLVANGGCLTEGFAQEMNDFCRGLGDCGGSVNVVGEWSGNYVVRRDGGLASGMFLSSSWIDRLVRLANPVAGQYAEVEDYSEYLAATGVWGGAPGAPGAMEADTSMTDNFGIIQYGLSGISAAMEIAATGQIMGFAVPGMSGGVLGAEVALGYTAPGIVQGPLSGMLPSGITQGASMAGFANAVMGAGIGMIVGMMIAKQLGLSEGGSMLMGIGGAMVGAAYMMTETLSLMIATPLFWVGIALIVIALFFGMGDCPPIEIEFECKPWQPPIGGDDCDACNGDPLKPCSKYRCESLGAGCELLNEGSGDELCVSGNSNDVTPPVIRRNSGVSFEGGSYEDGDDGFSVVGEGGACVDAYTPLAFGVVTSEPAQCRFDVEVKDFEEMSFDLGGNSYLYNHTGVFTLPDPSHGESQGTNWTGDLSLFVKCRDRYGLVSPGYYEISMCVVEGEDVTAPRIVSGDGDIVGFDVESKWISVVTNELASCRWSLEDVVYLEMENELDCFDRLGSPSSVFGYECTGVLPIGNSSEDYYVRCMDQPWLTESEVESPESIEGRNANAESFVFSLDKPSSKISIDKIAPDSGFEISSDFTTIELKIATSGGASSHFCSYSFSGYDRMIQMFETGADRTHTQVLNRGPGKQEIFVECRDETGDFVRSLTEFEIARDSAAPQIARIWQNGGYLNMMLAEEGTCKYSFDSCRFAWDVGVSLGTGEKFSFAAVKGERYFIRCEDEFGNAPSGCSVEVVAT